MVAAREDAGVGLGALTCTDELAGERARRPKKGNRSKKEGIRFSHQNLLRSFGRFNEHLTPEFSRPSQRANTPDSRSHTPRC